MNRPGYWTRGIETLWAVYVREVRERWQLLALAVFLTVLLPALSWLPLGYGIDPAAARQAIGIGFGVGYFGLCSLILGLSLFASEQASGRAGFFLSRPIAPWQLLLARVAAALTLVLAGSFLVVLPAFVSAPRGALRELVEPAILAVAACLLLLAAGHLAAVSFRLRGVWTLLDLSAFVATLLLFFHTTQAALRLLFLDLARLLPYLAGFGVLGAFLVALWIQLRHGGVGRGRLHAAFSIPFWLVVGGLLVACRAWLAHTGDKGWQDIRQIEDFSPSRQGTAAWVVGDIGGAPRPFFVDLDRRLDQPRVIELEPVVVLAEPLVAGRRLFWWPCVAEARVGRILRWSEPLPLSCHMKFLDLDADEHRPVETSFAADRDHLALSPDGTRIAQLTDQSLRVFAVPSLRLVGRYDTDPVISMVYGDEAGLLVRSRLEGERTGEQRSRLTRLSWEGLPLETADIDGEISHVSGDMEALVILVDDGVRFYDPATLDPLEDRPIRIEDARQRRSVSTGHVAYLTDRPGQLLRRAPDGSELEPVPLLDLTDDSVPGRNPYRRLGPELEPGRILVETSVSIWGRRSFRHLPWAGRRYLPNVFHFTRSARAVVYYVDVAAGEILATFEDYGVLLQTFGDASAPEAWLVDSRGLPHRFRPSAGLDEPSLEPLFAAPWAKDDGDR